MANIVDAQANAAKQRGYDTPRYNELCRNYREFFTWLKEKRHMSPSAIRINLQALEKFERMFGTTAVTESRALKFQERIKDGFAPKTQGAYITGLNNYIKFCGSKVEPLSFHEPKRTFLENVVTIQEYRYMLERLKEDGNLKWYFILHTLGSTGVRAQEVVMIQFDHILEGHMDIRSKHDRIRRIYFPKVLRDEVKDYVASGKVSRFDYVCQSRYAKANVSKGLLPNVSMRALGRVLKDLAEKYGVNTKVIYPHSFRHMFAKGFIAAHKDIALLSDLLGHASIETTRIYLRQTSEEQAGIVDDVVTW